MIILITKLISLTNIIANPIIIATPLRLYSIAIIMVLKVACRTWLTNQIAKCQKTALQETCSTVQYQDSQQQTNPQ